MLAPYKPMFTLVYKIHTHIVGIKMTITEVVLDATELQTYAERWVRSVKEETLSRLILFGECSLRHVLTEYVTHFGYPFKAGQREYDYRYSKYPECPSLEATASRA